jgi:sigma-B regulation protein RsbU (phosphoserine phosphatase)
MTILMVDDLSGIRLMLETILNDAGYPDVISVDSAQQDFDHLYMDEPSSEATNIDLILLDISMPEIDGVEACRTIKASPNFKDVPIIMVTGLAHSHDLKAAFAAGAVDYITKPPNMVEMLARVQSTVISKQEVDRRKSSYVSNLEAKIKN